MANISGYAPTDGDWLAWKQESQSLLKKSIPPSILLAIGTFCGGISLGNMYSPYLYSNLPYIWFPTPLMLIGWLGARLGWWSYFVPGYALTLGLSLSCALQLGVNQDPATATIIILSNLPVAVASSLLIFWKGKHALIQFFITVFMNVAVATQLTPEQLTYDFWGYYLVIPVWLASVGMSRYRYNSTQRFFFINRALQETNEELAASNDQLLLAQNELAQKNEAITDSIRYAKRIQNAILPDPQEIKVGLPNSFVFYRPKDIVSGDFYWYAQREGLHLLAVVDCTGHGVPGAFMSLLGFDGLNGLVVDQGITDPATILTRLDRQVSALLAQNTTEHKLRDGMEMILCVVNPEQHKVTFASAHRPVFIVREGVLEELKGSRFPIGDDQIKGKAFENTELNLLPGDTLYLTSDGFADQFGGPKNTKYYKKRFKAFLAELAAQPMEEQEVRLAKELDGWMGSHAQMDDITVAGLRL